MYNAYRRAGGTRLSAVSPEVKVSRVNAGRAWMRRGGRGGGACVGVAMATGPRHLRREQVVNQLP